MKAPLHAGSASTTLSAHRVLRALPALIAATAIALALGPSPAVDAAESESPGDDVIIISATAIEAGQLGQTYTMTVFNHGFDERRPVLASPVPAAVDIATYAATQGRYVSGLRLWKVGTLAPGAQATLTLIAL